MSKADSDDDHTMFAGLPTPAAAATIGSFAILSYSLRNENAVVTQRKFRCTICGCSALVPFLPMVISVLMVSRLPYPHPLTQFVRGQRSFAQLIAIVFSLMVILIVWNYAIPLLCVAFVCWPPVKYLVEPRLHRSARPSLCSRSRSSRMYPLAMFTGLVQSLAEVVDVIPEPPGVRLDHSRIHASPPKQKSATASRSTAAA